MRRGHRLGMLVGGGAAVAAGLVAMVATTYAATTHAAASSSSVAIADFSFTPNTLSVAQGTTVTWTNHGRASHTVTADGGAFDSSPTCTTGGSCLSPGQAFSFTFAAPGTYTYHCRIHTFMHGTIVVKAPAPA